MSVAAMVLAILGLVICWIPYVGFLGVLLGIVALILGIVSMKSPSGNKGLGIVGLVIGAIVLIVGGIVQTLTVIGTVAVVENAPGITEGILGSQPEELPPEAPFQQKP
ncbi:MAG: hypothetical protein M0R80_06355 [Proteobacteria bacterium]|nr:hypothetical protein [Pseudomonadota bacterium]